MPIARPRELEDALAFLAATPDADVLAGGTDALVEISFDHRRPEHVLALRRIEELRAHAVDDDGITLGAMVTYRGVEHALAADAPGLAMASRTVGSPQIRNAGTIGGNLGTASPAGDALPWLLAMDAEVELASVRGRRRVPLGAFLTGPKRTDRADDELIVAAHVPRIRGPQHTAKLGPRNAMVISVACVAVVVDTDARRVRIGMGSVGPTAMRAPEAEATVSAAIDWDALVADDEAIAAFGRDCAAAARPIDDHRSSADYRRHAIGVLASRALRRCLSA